MTVIYFYVTKEYMLNLNKHNDIKEYEYFVTHLKTMKTILLMLKPIYLYIKTYILFNCFCLLIRIISVTLNYKLKNLKYKQFLC